jgi:hypothetical protein
MNGQNKILKTALAQEAYHSTKRGGSWGGTARSAPGVTGAALVGLVRVVPSVGVLVVVVDVGVAGLLDDDPGEREAVVFDEEAVDVLELGLPAVEDPPLVGNRAGAGELAAEGGDVPAVVGDVREALATTSSS